MKLAYVKGKLNPGDVKRALQSKEHHQQVLDADGIVNQWRQLLTQHQIDKHEPQIAIALSCADMALCAMALGIKLPEERSYSGMQGLAHDLVVAVQAMGHNQVQSPWKVSCSGHDFVLQSNVQIPQDGSDGCICVFFLVGITHVQEDANMECFMVKEGQASIPCLRNTKVVDDGDKLLRFVSKKHVQPTALSFSPAKRQRTKSGA